MRVGKLLKWLVLALVVTLAVLILKPIPVAVDPIRPRDSTQYWTMSGGYKIAYTHVAANASLESSSVSRSLIYLHGGPGGYIHSSIIKTLEPLVNEGWDVYLYDQSGTGLSDRRESPKATTYDSHIDDLLEIVVQHIGADETVVIGHSFGGQLAATFAARHPGRLAGLILSAPGEIEPARFDDDGRWVNLAKYPIPDKYQFIDVAETYAYDTALSRLPVRAIASIMIAQLFDKRLASDAELDAAMNTMASGFTHNMVCDADNVQPEEGGGGAYSRTGTNFFPDGFDAGRDAMPSVRIPVVVIHGQCDFLHYAGVYEYVDRFANAEYQFIEGAGHIIWWDQPDAYRNAIRSFLAEVAKP